MAEGKVERRLAAIVALDVVGSSRLMAADEPGTVARLRVLRTDLLEPLVADHGGRIVKLMGDGALLAFASAVESVACAVALQAAVAEREGERPEDRRIRLRIGINVGEVLVQDDDLYGDTVHVAARLEPVAPPGGVCVSAKVRAEVGDRLDIRFEDLGRISLRNIDLPVQAYRVLAHGSAPPQAAPSAAGRERPVVAVLPLDNLSGDDAQSYFSDGLAEDLIAELSRFREIVVIARASSFAFRAENPGAAELGRRLGADYLVQGSVRRAGQRMRLGLQLVEATTGAQLWSERYDRDLDELFAVQDEIVAAVVPLLAEHVQYPSAARMAARRTETPKAYDHVLRARTIPAESEAANRESRALYERALALDPNSAAAEVGIARALFLDWSSGWGDDPDGALAEAERHVRRAVRLDPLDHSAHRVLGTIAMLGGRLDDARVHYERAGALNPNDPDVFAYRGMLALFEGAFDAVFVWLDRARRLNTHHAGWYLWAIGTAHYGRREYEAALPPLREAVARSPRFVAPRRHLAASLARLGRLDEARLQAQAILELDPRFSIARLAKRLPYRDPADLAHYLDGLRAAGLPE